MQDVVETLIKLLTLSNYYYLLLSSVTKASIQPGETWSIWSMRTWPRWSRTQGPGGFSSILPVRKKDFWRNKWVSCVNYWLHGSCTTIALLRDANTDKGICYSYLMVQLKSQQHFVCVVILRRSVPETVKAEIQGENLLQVALKSPIKMSSAVRILHNECWT